MQSAISKSLHWQAGLTELSGFGIPGGTLAQAPAVLAQIIGGVGLVLGFKTRRCSLLLIALMLPSTFYIHWFYRCSGDAFDHHLLDFFQNLTMSGGLVVLLVSGPGRWSVDAASNLSRAR